MPTDRSDKRSNRFTDLDRGVRADEIIFGNTGYTEEDMRFIADNTGTPVPDPDPTDPPFWNVTLGDNKLVADLFFFNYPTDAVTWAIGVNGVTPTYPDDYAEIPSGPPATNPLSDWVAETWAYYTADTNGTITEILDANGVSGILVTPNATAIPSTITDFTSDSSTDSTITVSFSSTTIVDGLTLQYDIIDTNTDQLLSSDGSAEAVTAGTVVITGLVEGTAYSPAVRVFPEDDVTRVYTSDPDPISTTSSNDLTFPTFSLADGPATGEEFADIATFATGGTVTPDEWYWVESSVPPTADSTWISGLPVVGTTELDLGTPGSHSIWAYVRLSTDPNNIIAYAGNPATVDLAPDAGTDIFSILRSATDLITTEMGAPTGTITVTRAFASATSLTVDITTTEDTAKAGVNYKSIDTTLSFPSGTTSVEVEYDVLQTNIGHVNGVPNEIQFNVALSNASGGSIDTLNGDVDIIIQGSNGYVGPDPSAGLSNALNGIDVNNPPTNLQKLTVPNGLEPAASSTYDGYEIDGAGAKNVIRMLQSANNVTLKRCIIKNCGRSVIEYYGWASGLTITNCLVQDWHLDWKSYTGPRWNNLFIKCYPLQIRQPDGENLSNITVRGVKAIGNGGFAQFQYIRGASGHAFENNHFRNTVNENIGTTRAEYINLFDTGSFNARDGTFIQYQPTTGGDHSIRDNVSLSKRSNYSGCVMDMYNIGGGDAPDSEAGRIFFEGNAAWGSVEGYQGSSFGYIMDGIPSGSTKGYTTFQYNISIEMPNGHYAMQASNLLSRRNAAYTNSTTEDVAENTVGLSTFGIRTNLEVTDNDVLCHKINPSTLVRSDNHRFIGSGGTVPDGWNANNILDGTDGNVNWDVIGDNELKGLKAVLNNPGIAAGIKVKYASYQCTSGNGILRWDYIDTSNGTLYFTAYGDSEGVGVAINLNIDSDVRRGDWQYDHKVYSANQDNWIYVVINPSLLKTITTDTSYKVKVTDFLYMSNTMIQPYNQDTLAYASGEWGGTDEVTIGGTTKPATPTNLIASAGASDGEIDLDWDDMSLPGYRVYRDGVLIASPITFAYTDTGRTTGVSYTYQVASISADTPPVLSDLSIPVSYTLTAAVANQLEDLDNDTYWSGQNLASITDNGDSTYTLTKDTSIYTGYRKIEFGTNASPVNATPAIVDGHQYELKFQHQNGSSKGRVVVRTTNSGVDWTGTVAQTLDDATLAEKTFYVTATAATELQIILYIESSGSGATTIYTTPTLEDLDA